MFDEEGRCGVAIWGDDPTTRELDGAQQNESLELVIVNEAGHRQAEYVTLQGFDKYTDDGLWIVELNSANSIPAEYGIIGAYPNPFNNRTRLTYGLVGEAEIDIALYDLAGRRIATLAKERQQAGVHAVTIDGSNLASGIYIVQLNTGEKSVQYKITLLK